MLLNFKLLKQPTNQHNQELIRFSSSSKTEFYSFNIHKSTIKMHSLTINTKILPPILKTFDYHHKTSMHVIQIMIHPQSKINNRSSSSTLTSTTKILTKSNPNNRSRLPIVTCMYQNLEFSQHFINSYGYHQEKLTLALWMV